MVGCVLLITNASQEDVLMELAKERKKEKIVLKLPIAIRD